MKFLAMMTILYSTVAMLAWACTANYDGCMLGDTRCDGNVVEICNADHNWETTLDCTELSSQVEGQYRCSVEPEGAVCMEIEVADAGE